MSQDDGSAEEGSSADEERAESADGTRKRRRSHDGIDDITDGGSAPEDADDGRPDKRLSAEQRYALQLAIDEGCSALFITGGAGTGKSHTLMACIDALREQARRNGHDPNKAVAVTATTGSAAANIGGETLHRMADLGLVKHVRLRRDPRTQHFPIEMRLAMVLRAAKYKALRDRWARLRVLVVDEVSMLSAAQLTDLTVMARGARSAAGAVVEDGSLMAGVRVVFCGDFLQLPPVPPKRGDTTSPEAQFAFKSEAWARIAPHVVVLRVSHRQREDGRFAALLAEVRLGRCPDDAESALRQRLGTRPGSGAPPVDAVILETVNVNAESHNARRLDALGRENGDADTLGEYTAVDAGPKDLRDKLDSQTTLLPYLAVRRGAKVVLTRNLSVRDGLCNGTSGVVVGFANTSEKTRWPVVRFDTGGMRASRQAHLVCTVEPVAVEISAASAAEGGGGSAAGAGVRAKRTQVPLRLAWAYTVHRAQGQTLRGHVSVSLTKREMFEYGHAYVALSRLTSLEHLVLRAFERTAIRAHPDALAFYALHGDGLTAVAEDTRPAKRARHSDAV